MHTRLFNLAPCRRATPQETRRNVMYSFTCSYFAAVCWYITAFVDTDPKLKSAAQGAGYAFAMGALYNITKAAFPKPDDSSQDQRPNDQPVLPQGPSRV